MSAGGVQSPQATLVARTLPPTAGEKPSRVVPCVRYPSPSSAQVNTAMRNSLQASAQSGTIANEPAGLSVRRPLSAAAAPALTPEGYTVALNFASKRPLQGGVSPHATSIRTEHPQSLEKQPDTRPLHNSANVPQAGSIPQPPRAHKAWKEARQLDARRRKRQLERQRRPPQRSQVSGPRQTTLSRPTDEQVQKAMFNAAISTIHPAYRPQ